VILIGVIFKQCINSIIVIEYLSKNIISDIVNIFADVKHKIDIVQPHWTYCSFPVAGPAVWNSLSDDLRNPNIFDMAWKHPFTVTGHYGSLYYGCSISIQVNICFTFASY